MLVEKQLHAGSWIDLNELADLAELSKNKDIHF
jgi:hypothetical protein